MSRPNIVLIVFDDMGFSDLGCYGSSIRTPHVDSLAARGVRHTRFDVTPLCSPTRAALLTGRNPHSVGMGTIVQFTTDHAGYSGRIPAAAAMLPKVLRSEGYGTGMFGKWHLSPPADSGPGGPYDQWPVARGFDRFYGFLPGRVHQFRPEIVRDNTFVEPPAGGAHVSELIVDEARRWIMDHAYARPSDPFFCYLSFGAVHSPHHAPEEYVRSYDGVFDGGWNHERERRFARQKEMGILSEDAELPPPDSGIPDWELLTTQEKLVAERLMGAYAGQLEHADAQIGRLVKTIGQLGLDDDTVYVVMSDNGATNAGGRNGTLNEEAVLNEAPSTNGQPPVDIDRIGGPDYLNQYSAGWGQASNTPFRRYKHTVHNGGTRSPLIVASGRAHDRGTVDHTPLFVTDVAPTLFELAGVDAPDVIDGEVQLPLHGRSFARRLVTGEAAEQRGAQYLEIGGHRAMIDGNWKAVTFHRPGDDFDADRWELYDLARDPTESHDVAEQHPDTLARLIELWWSEATKHNVLPLDVRGKDRLRHARPSRTRWTLYPEMTPVPQAAAPELAGRDFEIVADLDAVEASDVGVLASYGSALGGIALYIADGRFTFAFNAIGAVTTVSAPVGAHVDARRLGAVFTRGETGGGLITVVCDDRGMAEGQIAWTPQLRFAMDTFRCGFDTDPPVVADYAPPYPFTGRLHHVTVEVPGGPNLSRAEHALPF